MKKKNDNLDDVLDIFIRVNSGGVALSYSDLLLSTASANWKKYNARDEIIDFVDDINRNNFKIDRDFVLKSALVLSDVKDIAYKIKNFNKDNIQNIENNWETIKTSLYMAFELVKSFGYTSENLTSNNAIIPIAYYLKKIGLPKNYINKPKYSDDRMNIKNWLMYSLLKRTFGGQADTVLSQLRSIISSNNKNKFPLNEIINKYKGTNKTLIFTKDDINELLEVKYNEQIAFTILSVIYQTYDFNKKYHIDHLYPKSKIKKKYLKTKGVKQNKIDEYINNVDKLANLQLLDGVVNESKNNTDFDIWFNENYRTKKSKKKYICDNYLPNIEFTYDNYLVFIRMRNELLKNKLEHILNAK